MSDEERDEDPNVWNLVIDADAGGTSTRGVGLALACIHDRLCEIRDALEDRAR